MNKLFSVLAFVAIVNVMLTPADSLTKKERKFAIDYLKKTREDLIKEASQLSETQLNWRPADSVWSVAECVEHIAKSEKAIFDWAQMTLQEKADPDKRKELKYSDEEVIGIIKDRSHKVKTQDPLKPNREFGNTKETLGVFKERRNSLIDYIKKTDDDLRNHFASLPFGTIDSYQLLIFLAGHGERHTLQIKEVKASPGFPK